MSTYLYDMIEKSNHRYSEIEALMKIVNSYCKDDTIIDENLYDSSCRATIVMIVSHLEGFLDDVIGSVINDINDNYAYKESPYIMKCNMCISLLPPKPNFTPYSPNDVKELLRVFENNNIKFEKSAFTSPTKNPNPSVVDRLCKGIGLENFFAILDNSKLLDTVFESNRNFDEIISKLSDCSNNCAASFPYKGTSLLKFNSPPKMKSETNSLWRAFLDNLIDKRNRIAHGQDLENLIGHVDLSRIIKITRIFQLCFLVSVCNHITCSFTKSSQSETA